MADAGYYVRRVRRLVADVRDLILTGRLAASSSARRPSAVGHQLAFATRSKPWPRHAGEGQLSDDELAGRYG
jgi:hypothetical protein